METKHTKATSYLLISVLAIIWGSSFILMKRGLVVYSPYEIGALRMFVSFLCMSPFIYVSFKKVKRSQWKYLAAAGILGNAIPSILFPLAQTHLSSALAGMTNSLTPLFTYIVGISLFGMVASKNRMLGLLIGFAGALLLISSRSSNHSENDYLFSLFIVVATVCYAFSVNILRYKLPDLDPITTTSFALMFAGIPMGGFLFSTDFVSRTLTTDGSGFAFLCIVLLAMFGTAISTVLFNKLIKNSGALFASSVTYLIPIVAMVWGFFDGEKFGITHLFGLGAILFGVYMISRKKEIPQ